MRWLPACMSSTVMGKDGTLKSRIVPTLTPGSIATDPRTCVPYILTEYGMVNLKGLTTWERAEKIIGIAHPDFREALQNAGMILSGVSPDNRIVEMIELKDHPFFVGTQAHPEFKSRPNRAHPVFRGLIQAAVAFQSR